MAKTELKTYRVLKNRLHYGGNAYEPGDTVKMKPEHAKAAMRNLEPVDDPPLVEEPPAEENKPKATKAAKSTGDTPSKDSPE